MSDAFDAGIKALARKELSRAELSVRLARAGFDREDIELAVDRLVEDGYQSDERTAAERARALAARRYGDLAIRADLRRCGIADDEVEAAMADVAPEAARANALSQGKGDVVKLAQTLRRKGYTEDTVEAALQSLGRQG